MVMMGGSAPQTPRDLALFRPEWMILFFADSRSCLTIRGLDRRIGQRRDATRAPTQARNGWRPSGRLLVTPPYHLSEGQILSNLWGPPQVAALAGYFGLDNYGWIPHNEDTKITAQANWFVGESKTCVSYPLDARTAQLMGKNVGYAMPQVSCDDGPEHQIRITFYGREEQPEYMAVSWRCTREANKFTCYELSGMQRVP